MATHHEARSGTAAPLTDEALLAAFEAGRIPEGGFGHAEHVRVAWLLLGRMPLLDAIGRMRDGLRRLAERVGRPQNYHETVTWAWLALVHQRMRRPGAPGGWEAFAATNPDLLVWKDGPIFALYGPDILDSREAREIFVLPGTLEPRAASGAPAHTPADTRGEESR